MKGKTLLRDVLWGGLRRFDELYKKALPAYANAVLAKLQICDTALMGTFTYLCDSCQKLSYSYGTCQSRYCPHCQRVSGAKWAKKQKGNILYAPYFHLVFTIPKELRGLAMRNQRFFYKAMFDAASATLKEICEPYGQAGFIAVLQTWNKRLDYHPHIHVIFPAVCWNPETKQAKEFSVKLKKRGGVLLPGQKNLSLV